MIKKNKKLIKKIAVLSIASILTISSSTFITKAEENLESEFLSITKNYDWKDIIVENGISISEGETLDLSAYPGWKMSNNNTVKIDENGILTPINEGTVFLRNEIDDKVYIVEVYVPGDQKVKGYSTQSTAVNRDYYKVFVDPGHGGSDNGASGFGNLEDELNLKVAKLVEAKLIAKGIQVKMSRTSDVYVALSDRAKMANEYGADVFISIHQNSATNESASGIETYYHTNKTEHKPYSSEIQKNAIKETGAKDRGVKSANFAVLRESNMPSSLFESGFISNQKESANLASSAYQDKLSTAIANGIETYLKENIKLSNTSSVKVTNLVGQNRYETAIKISNRGWKNSENVILVNSNAMADALSATPFAKAKDAPIILTEKDKLNSESRKEIERLGAKNVYIIGAEGVVSEKVASELESMGLNVDRIGGIDRYKTSLEIAKRLENVSEIAVVNGAIGLADAVSISPVAASKNMPIVLSSPGEGTRVFDKFIKDNNIQNSYIIGGEGVISEEVASKLPNPERLGGINRNDTNSIIVEKFYTSKDLNNIFVAKNGSSRQEELIDALSVGVLAAKENSPVVIVGSSLEHNQEVLLASKKPKELTQVGGGGNENAFNKLVNIYK